MNIVSTLKRFVPPPLRPRLRTCLHLLRGPIRYNSRVQTELNAFTGVNVQDVPPIMRYWSKKYLAPMLAPFGFTDAIQFFRTYLACVCRRDPNKTFSFLSVGAGMSPSEINIAEWLREVGIHNYTFECLDINSELLKHARDSAAEKSLSDRFTFETFDVNSWRPRRQYDAILAIQSLHHIVELEVLSDKIHQALAPDGYFLTDDMIGRNGHQRWPEALKVVKDLWREMPDKYKYNHQLKRFEKEYENWDCSTEGFEGIRAQDILPLLIDRFHFDLFVPFGNIIDIFIDRGFGPNFDPDKEEDRAFIDRVHAIDVAEIEGGRVKPTHMLAALTINPVAQTIMYKHLSPEFCVRRPDPATRPRLRGWF
jgi:2-polyprenyl-3-methyl-5-hydroxy-6-metoxy-1,4-benzoquinol methylase